MSETFQSHRAVSRRLNKLTPSICFDSQNGTMAIFKLDQLNRLKQKFANIMVSNSGPNLWPRWRRESAQSGSAFSEQTAQLERLRSNMADLFMITR